MVSFMTAAHRHQFFVCKRKKSNFKMNKTISQCHLVLENRASLECLTSHADQLQRHGTACLIEALGNEQRLAHLSALVHHSSGIPTWQDCNALTIKLVSPSGDDRKYGTLGCLWDRDVASETEANISRGIAPPR